MPTSIGSPYDSRFASNALVRLSNGHIYVAVDKTDTNDIIIKKSTDGGVSFSTDRTITNATLGMDARFSLTNDSNDNVYIAYFYKSGANYYLVYDKYSGGAWSVSGNPFNLGTDQPSGTNQGGLSMNVNFTTGDFYFYLSIFNDIYLYKQTGGAGALSSVGDFNDGGSQINTLRSLIDKDGNIHVLFQKGSDLKWNMWNGSAFTTTVTISTTAQTNTGVSFYHDTIREDLRIVYHKAAGAVYYIERTGGSWGAEIAVGGTGGSGSGHPLINDQTLLAYPKNTTNDTKTYYRIVSDGGSYGSEADWATGFVTTDNEHCLGEGGGYYSSGVAHGLIQSGVATFTMYYHSDAIGMGMTDDYTYKSSGSIIII